MAVADALTPEEWAAIERHMAEKGVTRVPRGASGLVDMSMRDVIRQSGVAAARRSRMQALRRREAGSRREDEMTGGAQPPGGHLPAAKPADPRPPAPRGRSTSAEEAIPARRKLSNGQSADGSASRGETAAAGRAAPCYKAAETAGPPARGVVERRPREGLRPLPRIEAKGPRPGPWDARCRFALVPVSRLGLSAGDWQRAIGRNGARRIRRLVEGFDWGRFGAIVVREAGERFEIVDGQHRAAAARALWIEKVPAIVLPEAAAGAEVFLGLNRDRGGLSAVELYHAERAAGEDEAARLAAILDGLGISVPRRAGFARAPMTLACVAVARQILRRDGAHILEAGLGLIVDAWGEERAIFGADAVRAAARLAATVLEEAPEALDRAAGALGGAWEDAETWGAAGRRAAAELGGRAWQHMARLAANALAEAGGAEIALGVD